MIADTARDIEARLPAPFDVDAVCASYPVKYAESMNTVLQQEVRESNGEGRRPAAIVLPKK